MNCRRTRRLLAADRPRDAALTRHLAGCRDCQHFAERWQELRGELRRHRAGLLPDAGFVGRVVTRLGAPADPLEWAARRLLPATLALTLVLTGWCLLRTPAPASIAEQLASDDLLSWLVEAEDGR